MKSCTNICDAPVFVNRFLLVLIMEFFAVFYIKKRKKFFCCFFVFKYGKCIFFESFLQFTC